MQAIHVTFFRGEVAEHSEYIVVHFVPGIGHTVQFEQYYGTVVKVHHQMPNAGKPAIFVEVLIEES